MSLVTGSPLVEVKKILPRQIVSLFRVVVAGDQVKQGKPHPESYLKAARLFNLKPEQCLVVENAPLGIESAKRAGMFCVALTTSLPREYLTQADIIVGSLHDIRGIIG